MEEFAAILESRNAPDTPGILWQNVERDREFLAGMIDAIRTYK